MHELVKAIVEVSPHVRIEMNSSNAFGMRWGRNSIGENKGTRQAVEEDVLDVKELAHTVTCTTQGPQVHFLINRNSVFMLEPVVPNERQCFKIKL